MADSKNPSPAQLRALSQIRRNGFVDGIRSQTLAALQRKDWAWREVDGYWKPTIHAPKTELREEAQ